MKQFLFIALTILLFSSCDHKDNYDVKNDQNYEKSKVSLEDKEKSNPIAFITVSGDRKKNLIGQTVVKGKLFNNAKIVSYKDVSLKLSFYSKTGTVLEEDIETVYETVSPGGSKSFKSKYFTPKGTDSVGMKVLSAKY